MDDELNQDLLNRLYMGPPPSAHVYLMSFMRWMFPGLPCFPPPFCFQGKKWDRPWNEVFIPRIPLVLFTANDEMVGESW